MKSLHNISAQNGLSDLHNAILWFHTSSIFAKERFLFKDNIGFGSENNKCTTPQEHLEDYIKSGKPKIDLSKIIIIDRR